MADTLTDDHALLARLADLIPEIAAIQELAEASMTLAAVRALVRTTVFDHVEDEPRPIAEVADAAGVHPLALHRVLRAVEPRGFVALDGDRVAATSRTALLRSDSPFWPTLAHVGSGDVAHDLSFSLTTGASAWEHTHGAPFFEWLAAHPEQEELFARAMRNEGVPLNLLAVPHIDLGGVSVVADVGGGTGSLLASLLDANPDVRGILVDVPSVLERAVPALASSGRCTLHAGDLFGDMPPADAYVLARILHDWDDAACERILRGIRAAAAPGARLYDLDLVVPAGSGRTLRRPAISACCCSSAVAASDPRTSSAPCWPGPAGGSTR